MNKGVKAFCTLVMAAAFVLTVWLAASCIRTADDLSAAEKELMLSRENWETIAAEKEALQEELSDVSGSLREAQLTLTESETRSLELQEEISQLNSDIAGLSAALKEMGIDPDQSSEETQ